MAPHGDPLAAFLVSGIAADSLRADEAMWAQRAGRDSTNADEKRIALQVAELYRAFTAQAGALHVEAGRLCAASRQEAAQLADAVEEWAAP